MIALPIVGRELRVASRKWTTYWNRCLVAFGGIVVATFAILILSHSSPKQTGNILFIWMSVIAYVNCLLGGLVLTSDCLSEEKREGTLGLLFLTDLKGYDVVFGKLAAHSLRGIYGMLAIFPVLGICLLMGGVSGAQFTRVMLTSLNCLFLSLSLGLLASALCRDERKAMALAFLVVLVLSAGLPALGGWVAYHRTGHQFPLGIMAGSPGYTCFAAFDGMYKPEPFWTGIVTQHVMAWVALAIACVAAPRSWQDRVTTAGAERRQNTFRQWVYGPVQVRTAFRRRLLHVNPYYWLTSRDRFKHTLPWVWLSLVGLIWLLGLMRWPSEWRDEGTYITTAVILHGLFKMWVALEASRRLGSDRYSGALELLLSTPITVPEILRGQWMGLMRQFAVPIIVVLAADLIFVTAGWPHNSEKEWLYLWLCGISVFVADLFALAWLSMWLGLLNRRTGQGGVNAIVQIMVLPWLGFMGFTALMAVLDAWHLVRTQNLGGVGFVFFVWWAICIAVDAFFGIYAYRRLHRDLRAVATERYVTRVALWGRMLGTLYGRWRTEREAIHRGLRERE